MIFFDVFRPPKLITSANGVLPILEYPGLVKEAMSPGYWRA